MAFVYAIYYTAAFAPLLIAMKSFVEHFFIKVTTKPGATADSADSQKPTDGKVQAKVPDSKEARAILQATNTFFVLSQLIFLVFHAANLLSHLQQSRADWKCISVFVASMPMAKHISVPMWAVLMMNGQFSHWLLHKHNPPKRQTGIPAGAPPLGMNTLTLWGLVVTSLVYLSWLGPSIPIVALLMMFPLTSAINFIVLPVFNLVVLPLALTWVCNRYKVKYSGVPPSFTLKIAASVLFCAVASSVRFVDFYTGGLSYVDVMAESLQDMASLCSSFVGLWQLRTLSFTWPSFDLPSVGLSFTMSVELAAVSFLLEYFVSMYFRLVHTDEEGRKVLFSMEGVTVKKRARDVYNFEYGEPEGETGRCRLKKGQVAYFCARIIDNVAMGSATIISAAMAKIMYEQNKKQVFHRMNFQYVTDEVCCQFAFDNPRVRTVDLTGCINVTTRTLAVIGSTLATTVTAKSCKLAGPIPSFANTGLQVLDLGENQLTGPIPSFAANTVLSSLHLNDNQLTGKMTMMSRHHT